MANLTPVGTFTRLYFFGLLFAYVVAEEIEKRQREIRRLESRLARLERPNLLRELARTRCATPRGGGRGTLAAVPNLVDELPHETPVNVEPDELHIDYEEMNQ